MPNKDFTIKAKLDKNENGVTNTEILTKDLTEILIYMEVNHATMSNEELVTQLKMAVVIGHCSAMPAPINENPQMAVIFRSKPAKFGKYTINVSVEPSPM